MKRCLGPVSDGSPLARTVQYRPGRMVVNHRNPTQNKVAAKIPASQGYLISLLHYTRGIRSLQSCVCVSYQMERTP
jgi:hypothetical protein